jgi:hypothetical protein
MVDIPRMGKITRHFKFKERFCLSIDAMICMNDVRDDGRNSTIAA